MSCPRSTELNDLLDGVLDRARREQLERHLEGCPDCRRERESLASVIAATRQLPASVTPSRDLWSGIEARLGSRRAVTAKPRWLGLPVVPAALAASLLIAIGLAALWRLGPTPRPGVGNGGTASLAVVSPVAIGSDLARHEDGALVQRRLLVEALEHRRGQLPSQLFTSLETDAEALDRAIGEIRLALEDRPQSHRLNQLLKARYQQEVHLLMRLQQL